MWKSAESRARPITSLNAFGLEKFFNVMVDWPNHLAAWINDNGFWARFNRSVACQAGRNVGGQVDAEVAPREHAEHRRAEGKRLA